MSTIVKVTRPPATSSEGWTITDQADEHATMVSEENLGTAVFASMNNGDKASGYFYATWSGDNWVITGPAPTQTW